MGRGGQISINHGGSIENRPSGDFGTGNPLLEGDFDFSIVGVNKPSDGKFVNSGKFGSFGGGTLEMYIDIQSDGGNWAFSDNTILDGNCAFSVVHLTPADGVNLNFGRTGSSSTFSFSDTTIDGGGWAYFQSGTFVVPDWLSLDVPNSTQNNGSFDGLGTVYVNHYFNYAGGLWNGFGTMEIAQNAELDIHTGNAAECDVNRTVDNYGTMLVVSNSGYNFTTGADITNQSGGTINFQSVYFSNGGGVLNNLNGGIVNYYAGRACQMKMPYKGAAGSVLNVNNAGARFFKIDLDGGQAILNGSPQVDVDTSLTLENGGELLGAGAITTPLVDNISGIIMIAQPTSVLPYGTLTINGAFQQESGELGFRINAGGASDLLFVNGSATLGGTLSLFGDQASPAQPGDSWTPIKSSQSISGSFAAFYNPHNMQLDYSNPLQVTAYVPAFSPPGP